MIGDVLDWMDKNKEHLCKVYCPSCNKELHYQEDTYWEQNTDCSMWECMNSECIQHEDTEKEREIYQCEIDIQLTVYVDMFYTLIHELQYKYREPIEKQTDECIDFIISLLPKWEI